jgi:hypothetical protein
VCSYGDRDEVTWTFIFVSEGSPEQGWTTCSTVQLHRHTNLLEDRDVRVELMARARESDRLIANVVATAAFNVMKDGWLAAPGVVFPDLVAEYFVDTTTPHVMWADPFSDPELRTVEISGVGTVHWLLAVPLSAAEVEFLHEHGYDALEERLGAAGAEYFDLWRESVV